MLQYRIFTKKLLLKKIGSKVEFWVIFCIFFFFSFLLFGKYTFIPWIFMAFFTMFRYKIGTDYIGYNYIYEGILNKDKTIADLLHIVLVKMTDILNFNEQFIFVFYGFFTMLFFYKGYKFFAKNYISMILFGIFFFSFLYISTFEAIRQMLASAIFLYSIQYIIKKNIIIYCICITIAFVAHKSAILLFPLYWIFNIRLSRQFLFFYFLICFILLNFNPTALIEKLFSTLNLPYSNYFYSEVFNQKTTIHGVIMTIIFSAILPFIGILNKNNAKDNIICNSILIMFLIRILSMHMYMFGRLNVYFEPFFVIYIVYIFIFFINKISSFKFILLYSFILSLFIFSVFSINILFNQYSAYRQYAMNFSVFSKNDYIIQIYGDYHDSKFWAEE